MERTKTLLHLLSQDLSECVLLGLGVSFLTAKVKTKASFVETRANKAGNRERVSLEN